ncbi:MAG: ComEA family DNA-binding protein [Phycisphaeraceae bacterium]|nr:ComEA family DNA-binding protein [Phycisphaeraceae bacterium]
MAVLGVASIGGMIWSIGAWRARERAAEIDPARRISLNTASVAELQLLPEIGPVLAERIARDRAENGPFERVEDLARVEGIGERTVARIVPFASVDR